MLGAERPAKRRLEMHLRGRAGRQGGPGEAKFFVCFDDELMKVVLGEKQAAFWGRRYPEGEHIPKVATSLTSAQARAAASEAEWLTQNREFDQVLADQQHLIYAERVPAVRGEDMSGPVRELIEEVVRAQVTSASGEGLRADRFWRDLLALYPADRAGFTLPASADAEISKALLPRLAGQAAEDAQRAYHLREEQLDAGILRNWNDV